MLTIYDLAKSCGIAPSTVSKVLNNYKGVSKKTRELVIEQARIMGYLPNTMARSLNTNRSYNIGVLIFIHDSFPGLKHSFFMSIVQTFKRYVESKGYDITLISKSIAQTNGSFLNHVKMKKMDGMLLFGDYSNEHIIEVLNSDIPTVAFDYFGENASGVTCNNFKKAYELASYIAKLNHKNIIYVCGDKNEITDIRLNAFLQAMHDNNIALPSENIIQGRYCNYEASFDIAKDVLIKKNTPTAIMFPDDISAIAGYAAAYELGFSVPEDISITGFDGIDFGKMIRPKLCTIAQDIDAIGFELGRKLLSLIDNRGQSRHELIEVPAKFFLGESCKKI